MPSLTSVRAYRLLRMHGSTEHLEEYQMAKTNRIESKWNIAASSTYETNFFALVFDFRKSVSCHFGGRCQIERTYSLLPFDLKWGRERARGAHSHRPKCDRKDALHTDFLDFDFRFCSFSALRLWLFSMEIHLRLLENRLMAIFYGEKFKITWNQPQ